MNFGPRNVDLESYRNAYLGYGPLERTKIYSFFISSSDALSMPEDLIDAAARDAKTVSHKSHLSENVRLGCLSLPKKVG